MKTKVAIFILFLILSVTFLSSVSANEFRVIPRDGSGLSQDDLTGAKVTLDGATYLSGILNKKGFFRHLADEVLDVKAGEYTLSISQKGYKPFKEKITIPQTPEGLPKLTISKKVSLKPLPPPPPVPSSGSFPSRIKSLFLDENFLISVTIALLIAIVVLVIAILIFLRRKHSAYSGGAVASPQEFGARRAKRSERRSKASSPSYDEKPIASSEGRFTDKHFGRYLVTKSIARGGMAYVLEAEFEKGGGVQKAALKIPYENYQEDREYINRFNQEAKLGDILFHENIIEIYEYGTTETGVKYIAMEFVDGADLRKIMDREETIESSKAAKIVMDIAKALDYAHGQNPPVYHRDIKPENIMFRDKKGTGLAVLTDFGIATQGGTMGTGKALIGTALYSCPDAAKGYPVSPGYDIYSLGVVFYEMLTGKVPFSGADYYTIMRKHEEGNAKPPREIKSKVSAELETIVMKMMERDPKKRFETAKELLITLRDYLNR